jgi:predicted membrane channel-forming protein YqfA (hemolysin III family)
MFKRSKNLNDNERLLRMALGFILLFASLWLLTDLARVVVIVLATYAIVTGVVAYCPAAEAFSSSSPRRVASRSHHHRRHH